MVPHIIPYLVISSPQHRIPSIKKSPTITKFV
jgi:hypothetical protein